MNIIVGQEFIAKNFKTHCIVYYIEKNSKYEFLLIKHPIEEKLALNSKLNLHYMSKEYLLNNFIPKTEQIKNMIRLLYEK